MALTNLDKTSKSVNFINNFGGYNHQAVIQENEFYDELNMSCVEAPIVRTREKRNKKYLCEYQHGGPATTFESTKVSFSHGESAFKINAEVDEGDAVLFNHPDCLYYIIENQYHEEDWDNPIALDGKGKSKVEIIADKDMVIRYVVAKAQNASTKKVTATKNENDEYYFPYNNVSDSSEFSIDVDPDPDYYYAGTKDIFINATYYYRDSEGDTKESLKQLYAPAKKRVGLKSIYYNTWMDNEFYFYFTDDNYAKVNYFKIKYEEKELPAKAPVTLYWYDDTEKMEIKTFDPEINPEINLVANEKLGYMSLGTLYYDGFEVENFGEPYEPNKVVSMGTKIVSFPKKRVYDTETNYVSNIEQTYDVTISGYTKRKVFDKIFVQGYDYYKDGSKWKKQPESHQKPMDGFANDNIAYIPLQSVSKNGFTSVTINMCSSEGTTFDEFSNINNLSCSFVDNNPLNTYFEITSATPYVIASNSTTLGYNIGETKYGLPDVTSAIVVVKFYLKAKKKLSKNTKYPFYVPTVNLVDSNIDMGSTPYMTISMCDKDKNIISINFDQNLEPSSEEVNTIINNGQNEVYWIDRSVDPAVIKQYSPSYKTWFQVTNAYYIFQLGNVDDIPCSSEDTDWHDTVTNNDGFKKNDNVEITCGLEDIDSDGYEIVEVGTDYVVINMVYPQALYENGITHFTMKRSCPTIDYCCERDNRIWGCSIADNEIYASVQGDPTNWNQFKDLSTDAYALEVGSQGKFTGCFNYMGYVLFFKENYIHKIYGTKPANFYLQTIKCDGVADGSWDTLVMIRDTLFYKTKYGICAYSGTVPTNISKNLGLTRYTGGHASSWNDRYFIFFDDITFVYDTTDGIWHIEDARQLVSNMLSHYLDLYYVSRENDQCYLYRTEKFEEGNIEESDFEWFLETGDWQLNSPYNKYIGRLLIRCTLSSTAKMKIEIKYDNGNYQTLKEVSGPFGLGTLIIPVLPHRNDHLRLKLSGSGDTRIYSISKEVEEVGEQDGNS